jgi:hypothetical protein
MRVDATVPHASLRNSLVGRSGSQRRDKGENAWRNGVRYQVLSGVVRLIRPKGVMTVSLLFTRV